MNNCEHLCEFLNAEIEVISKHIANHKWFNHISDEDEGIIDFIQKYGWLMREMYCNYICIDRNECQIKNIPNTIRDKK